MQSAIYTNIAKVSKVFWRCPTIVLQHSISLQALFILDWIRTFDSLINEILLWYLFVNMRLALNNLRNRYHAFLNYLNAPNPVAEPIVCPKIVSLSILKYFSISLLHSRTVSLLPLIFNLFWCFLLRQMGRVSLKGLCQSAWPSFLGLIIVFSLLRLCAWFWDQFALNSMRGF